MLINHGNNVSAGYSIDLTPLTEPTGTYYAAIQWDGGYTGLVRGGFRYDRQLQFSVWDAPGFGSAELIDKASDVVCRAFGAEGTGVACELNYPWKVGSAYRFEITEEEMNGGSAMTLHVALGGRLRRKAALAGLFQPIHRFNPDERRFGRHSGPEMANNYQSSGSSMTRAIRANLTSRCPNDAS